MAGFGAQNIRFAKFLNEEKETETPKYDVPVSLGPLMTANMTVTLAAADMYGDNVQQEKVSEFVSAALPTEITECPKTTLAILYGASYDETKKELSYNSSDAPPYGGLSYIKNLKKKGATIYEPHFLTKAQAALGNENAQTKGASITFQQATINFTVLPPLCPEGDWHHVSEFTTLAAAVAWIDEKYGVVSGENTEGEG